MPSPNTPKPEWDRSVQECHITYRVTNETLFYGNREHKNETDAEVLVNAMLSGMPPLEAGYELVRVEP